MEAHQTRGGRPTQALRALFEGPIDALNVSLQRRHPNNAEFRM